MDEKPHVSFHSHDRESFSLCGGLGVFSRDGIPVIESWAVTNKKKMTNPHHWQRSL